MPCFFGLCSKRRKSSTEIYLMLSNCTKQTHEKINLTSLKIHQFAYIFINWSRDLFFLFFFCFLFALPPPYSLLMLLLKTRRYYMLTPALYHTVLSSLNHPNSSFFSAWVSVCMRISCFVDKMVFVWNWIIYLLESQIISCSSAENK